MQKDPRRAKKHKKPLWGKGYSKYSFTKKTVVKDPSTVDTWTHTVLTQSGWGAGKEDLGLAISHRTFDSLYYDFGRAPEPPSQKYPTELDWSDGLYTDTYGFIRSDYGHGSIDHFEECVCSSCSNPALLGATSRDNKNVMRGSVMGPQKLLSFIDEIRAWETP